MRTLKDEITIALHKNGESWEDIEYTTFTDEELGMYPDYCDMDLYPDGYEVVAYTEEWVYYADFASDWEFATVHSLPRHPRVFIELEEVRQNIISKVIAAMK